MPRTLVARLVLVAVVVGAGAVLATAWLTVQTTTGAFHEQQGQQLASDGRIYTSLVDYAADHHTWAGATDTVDRLAASTGRRIVLVDQARSLIADSDPDAPRPTSVSAVIDPLSVDPRLMPQVAADHIAPRALGPLRLDREVRQRLLSGVGLCDRAYLDVVHQVEQAGSDPAPAARSLPGGPGSCVTSAATRAAPNTFAAYRDLLARVRTCLGDQPVVLAIDPARPTELGVVVGRTAYLPYLDAPPAVSRCVSAARRDLLASYVAPSALLYVTDVTGAAEPTSRLTSGNLAQIGGAVAAVLLLGAGATILTARRLSRPLRDLTAAAQGMQAGDLDVRVPEPARPSRDEIGRLSAAFNEMAGSRQRLEGVRRSMVADVAHELRTPLGNIRGWLEAIQDGVADPDPALISSLHGQAVQLQALIDDLQDLAVSDAGRLVLHRVDLSVPDLLERTRTAYGAEAAGKDVELCVDAGPGRVTADPVRLQQALDNLVSNAIRHTPSGGRVTLRGRQGTHVVQVDVVDTGVGIAADDLPHVFDRFWRADGSRSRATGGSGLGLAIARSLARAHGGDLVASSVSGEGSVFSLTLPVG